MKILYLPLILIFFSNITFADNDIGNTIFNSNCAACHLKSAPNLFNTKLNKKTFINIVNMGRRGTMMGAFQGKISNDDIEKIYYYLLSKKE